MVSFYHRWGKSYPNGNFPRYIIALECLAPVWTLAPTEVVVSHKVQPDLTQSRPRFAGCVQNLDRFQKQTKWKNNSLEYKSMLTQSLRHCEREKIHYRWGNFIIIGINVPVSNSNPWPKSFLIKSWSSCNKNQKFICLSIHFLALMSLKTV